MGEQSATELNWDKTHSRCESRQTLTSLSDSVLHLMRIAQARFLSDTTHCPKVGKSLSVVRQWRRDGS